MTNPRQIIGNGGNRPEVHTRSLTTLPPQIGDDRAFGQYPGLGGGNPFSDFSQGGGFPTPFQGGGDFFGGNAGGGGGFFGGGGNAGGGGGGFFGGGGGNAGATGGGGGGGGNFLSNLLGGGGGGAATGGSSNPLSGLNMKQISGFVERMGGIDGILGTMGKVQKFMSSFQQMAPMVKTIFSALGKGKVASGDSVEVFRPRRKRRKKSGSASRRKGGSKSGTAKRKRR
ncbi:aminotransferase [Paenibacillus chondroitinus]|uniref:Aminotransferase n=1 Tax=Paenibacillus chondroitinus TaxID=59842 RepID=A0ABU6DJI8_9BACL|nr:MULTISPECIES: aminotransferase [Paenibacillus]MCY9661012.1 aminotransferase [Paenibacillus anseongense]MEB4797929.1 aminotransferase [Paenibacillus chondroitinus]